MKIKLEVTMDLDAKTFDIRSDDINIEHSGSCYLRMASREKNLYGTIGGWIPEKAFEVQQEHKDGMWLHIALGKPANGWTDEKAKKDE
jgi:hypothetical protein